MCKNPQNWHLLTNCVCNRGVRSCLSLISHCFALPAPPRVARCVNHPASQTRLCISAGGAGHHPTLAHAAASPMAVQLFVQLCRDPYWGTGSAARLRGRTELCSSGAAGAGGAHVKPRGLGVGRLELVWTASLEGISLGAVGDGAKAVFLDAIVLTPTCPSTGGMYSLSF